MKKVVILILCLGFISSAYNQCPATAPSNFDSTDGGAKGCTANTWKHEQAVTYANSGDCLNLSGSGCDLSWHTVRYDLNCSFCAEFSFTLSTLTSDGIAFSMVDNTNRGADFPCSTPYGCAEGGNLGYNNLGNTAGGGALTIEIDVFNNSPADADPVCDHVSIVEDGDNSTFEQQACLPNMDDGNPHTFRMCWDATNNRLTITIDGVNYIVWNQDIRTYFDDNSVNFAFSSGYNGSFAGQNQVCSFNITPLPLNAAEANFAAKLVNSNVELSWVNSSKANVLYEVERSTDGINFSTINSINSNLDASKYLFYDYNPQPGINYYRLKEVELLSGLTTRSATQVVTLNNNSNFDINVAGNTGFVNVKSKVETDYYLNVYDMSGKAMINEKYTSSSETQLKNLSNGMYVINLVANGENITKKILILND